MSKPPDEDALAAGRERMVKNHLVARGIHDKRVLEAFRRVPRERFVPPASKGDAYGDHPLAIGHGQTISQPYMVALMSQELSVAEGHRVLEIGTGSGYQTAILAALGAQVYTVERIAELSDAARQRLEDVGFTGIRYHVGDGTLGWPEDVLFDRIMVTAGSPETPPSLVRQLADGGRMAIPVGGTGHQDLMLVDRRGEHVDERFICGCVFVKLIGEEGWR